MMAIWLALDIVFNIPDSTNSYKIYWTSWFMCNNSPINNMPNCVKSALEPGEIAACIFTPIITLVILWEVGKWIVEKIREVDYANCCNKCYDCACCACCTCCPGYRTKTTDFV
jgi:hypothetical protein